VPSNDTYDLNMKNKNNKIDKITFFFRTKDLDFSIEKIFKLIIPTISLKFSTESVSVPFFRIKLSFIIKNLIFCRKHKSEINHITGVIHYCSLALPYSRTIITIHDMISVEKGKGLKKYFFWFFFFYLPIKRCKYVTCISESVRDALLHYKCCPASKLTVIPNPVSDSYIYTPKDFNKDCPRILHIGTRPNKNLQNVIKSLYQVPCHLIIIGELLDIELILLNQLKINYTNKINLTDNQILNEYIDCDIVSFPSVFEGFGVPIIEGQAIGRPVLTSNILPMKQVVGDNYYTIDPYNIEAIKTGFRTIINSDEVRNKMIELGLVNVHKYRPEIIASKYIDLYFKILKD